MSNIKVGDIVQYLGTNGYPAERDLYEMRGISVGDHLHVIKMVIHDWHTEVFTQEYPGLSINSVCLAPIKD